MNKKVLGLSVAAVIIAAILGYFVVVPLIQVSAYKSTIGENQPKIDRAINELANFQSKDSFAKADVEVGELRADIKSAQDAVQSAESALQTYGPKLSLFNELPLLSLNPGYKTALDLKAHQVVYIQSTQEFVTEMKAILEYSIVALDSMEKNNEAEVALESTATATTIPAIQTGFNTAAVKFAEALAIMESARAPESLKESHDLAVAAIKDIIVLNNDAIDALKTLNIQKLQQVESTTTDKMATFTAKSNELVEKYISDSKIAKLAEKIKEEQQAIDALVVKL